MSRKTLLVVAAVVLAACGGGGGASVDVEAVADDIAEELEDRGVDPDVECPEDAGDEGFECDVTTEGGLEFEVEVEVDGEDTEFELPLVFTRTGLEDGIAELMAADNDGGVVADCADVDEELLAEDGDTLLCGAALASGDAQAVEVTIDEDADLGFTVELVEGSFIPGEEPAEDEEEAEAPAEDDDGAEFTFEESFDDNSNVWFEGPSAGLNAELLDGVYVWTVESAESLPFESFPDTLLPVADQLDEVVVSATVSVDAPGVIALTCMVQDPTGADLSEYILALRSGRLSILESDVAGATETLASTTELGTIDAAGINELVASCVHDADTGDTRIVLTVVGEDDTEVTIEATDPDGLASGFLGVLTAFDAEVPEAERQPYQAFVDNFFLEDF